MFKTIWSVVTDAISRDVLVKTLRWCFVAWCVGTMMDWELPRIRVVHHIQTDRIQFSHHGSFDHYNYQRH